MRMTKAEIIGLIEKANKLLDEDDPLDASEKLYKAAEESIKVLAIMENPTLDNSNYWSARTLWDQVEILKNIYGDELRDSWDTAWTLHTQGFHEHLLSREQILERMQKIVDLVNLIK